MNKIGLGIAVVGIVICLIGAGLFVASGERFGSLEESRQYEGRDGEMKLEGYAGGGWLIVTMEGNYSNGKSVVIDGGASLKQEDCDLVKNFTLTGEDSQEYFIPTCDNRDDTTEDGWIHIGVICDSDGKYSNQTKGCPDGTYTWDTNGTLINVWDGEELTEGIMGGLAALGSGFFACCCGVVVLIIGIVLAFVLQEEDTSQYYQSNTETGSSTTSGAKGWDEQTDYIHKEKKEEVPEKSEITTPEDKKEEKKRSGEYELPPPPEM